MNTSVRKGGNVNIKIKTKWSDPNDRWLIYFWHSLKGRWFQMWDIKDSPWDCMSLSWLGGFELDKDIEQTFNVTIEQEK